MMLEVNQAITIHNVLIADFGGAKGVRDMGSLESALARPYQTFDGIELYATPQAKASALMESLAINHPFVDGNKRIAYTLFRLLLLNAGVDITADLDARYAMVIDVSKGEMRFDELLKWVEKYLVAAA